MSVRNRFFLATALVASVATVTAAARAQDTRDVTTVVAYSTDELDNLLAPIALYPDAILAQVLIAATFPEQIDLAAQFVRARGTRDIDDQPWDVSVKSVAHYPPVLNMLADRPDWTTALGQAYAMQSTDVMESVQHLRELANAEGNLRSTAQQNVVVDGRYIRIEPAQPRVIYVPTYDPAVIYYRPVVYVGALTPYWTFGVGFPIGAWLTYDCDWYGRRVYYTGWHASFGWRVAAFPYIHITPVYVHPRYEVVYVNRTVIHRHVNYDRLRVYNTVHRTVTYDNHRRGGAPGPIRHDDRRGDDRGRPNYDGRNNGRPNARNDAPPRRDNARPPAGVPVREPVVQGKRDQSRVDDRTVQNKRAPSRTDDRARTTAPPTDRRASAVAPRQVPSREVQSAPRPVQKSSPRQVQKPPVRQAPVVVQAPVRQAPVRKAQSTPPASRSVPVRVASPPVSKGASHSPSRQASSAGKRGQGGSHGSPSRGKRG